MGGETVAAVLLTLSARTSRSPATTPPGTRTRGALLLAAATAESTTRTGLVTGGPCTVTVRVVEPVAPSSSVTVSRTG